MYKTIEKDMFLFVPSISKPYMYGFDNLEQRETCLIQWFYSLMKVAVRVCAGGLKATMGLSEAHLHQAN